MDYFFNSEFIETEREIDLISLGIVAADGREFYAISTEFDASRANDFVRTVVLPLLEPRDHPAWMSRAEMKEGLLAFIGTDIPRFWSWLAAPYDWMVMAQLSPVDPSLPQAPPNVHHALADARWVRDLHNAVGEAVSAG